MFSNDPSTLTRKEKFDKEEAVRAIRNAIAAEIDAINFYLQQNKYIDDEKLRKVHEDITKEEMTHFGEFLRLLYQLSPEDFSYFKKGWEEASKLIGESKDFPLIQLTPSESRKDPIVSWIIEGIMSNRVVRNIGNMIKYEYTTVPFSEVKEDSGDTVQSKSVTLYEVPLISSQVKFYLGQKNDSRRTAIVAGKSFAKIENQLLLKNHPLSPLKMGTQITASDWNVSGNILLDVLRAYENLAKEGFGKDIYVLISSSNYSKTFRVVDRTGTYEIEMIKEIGNVVPTDIVNNDEIYIISKQGFDILVFSEANVEYLSKERDYEVYLITEQIAPRLISSSASCTITQKTS
ncbi:MAG: encapsulin [Saccharolobus sp.]|uniref:encapsulin n=1 Tax=Saccharolobus TaxID=2100760 RepID=UPI001F0E3834|nr:encapsulin [Saccharolobus shibatae]MCH4815684.1 encapsulin [Saccharolobus shibatae]